MIVKTGANYQTEGGYIEASKSGDGAVVTINDDTASINTMIGIHVSAILVDIRKTADTTPTITMSCYYTDGPGLHNGNISVTTDSQLVYELRGGFVPFVISPSTPIKLAEGSKDCEIVFSNSRYYLGITGNNPVCIVEATE